MTRIARVAAIAFAFLVAATFLPRLHGQLTRLNRDRQEIAYSTVDSAFMTSRTDRFGQKTYTLESGERIDRKTWAGKLPFRFSRDLMRWNEMPETVAGVPVRPKTFFRELQTVMFRPRELSAPVIPVYPVLEAASGFTSLELPGDMMTFEDGVRVYRCEDASIDAPLSETFTAAFKKAGFVFPLKQAWGNPSLRKPFDWGWFLLDANGDLFHLMRIKGRPMIRKTGIGKEIGVRYVQVEEHPGKRVFGILIDDANRIYRIQLPGYGLEALPVGDFDPEHDRLIWRRDPVCDQFSIKNRDTLRLVVARHDPDFVTERTRPLGALRTPLAVRVGEVLFPVRVRQPIAGSRFVGFDVIWVETVPFWMGFRALLGVGILALWRRRSIPHVMETPEDWVLALVGGLPGVLAISWAGRLPGHQEEGEFS